MSIGEPLDNGPVDLAVEEPRRVRTKPWLGAIAAIGLVGLIGYVVVERESAPVEKTSTVTTESQQEPAYRETPEPKPTAEEIAATKKRLEDDEMEYAVKEQLCLDYGERYVAAKTGVQLIKAVQLSQAAGCNWKGMLHADATTHDFVPEAVEAMRRLDASEVTTGGSASEENADRFEKLDRSISDLDRKVNELRYRVR